MSDHLKVIRHSEVPLGECWISEDTPPFPVLPLQISVEITDMCMRRLAWLGEPNGLSVETVAKHLLENASLEESREESPTTAPRCQRSALPLFQQFADSGTTEFPILDA